MMDAAYIYALGWTLIHSIWQLTLLALLFYGIMLAWKDRKPVQRYHASLLFMLISLSVTSLTFIVMFRKFSTVPSGIDHTLLAGWQPMVMSEYDGGLSWWQSLTDVLQTHVTSLTYLYMMGVALLMLRMGFNLWGLNRLKTQATPITSNQFDFLTELMEKLNLQRRVLIRSTSKVQMPMVIGAFQPVILIPLSLLSNTSPDILKAVISHELAHIERHDFAVNLIQTIVETLFFYHPAVWYFSYMARREREFCCDQRAVDLGCRREDLVRALTEVGELQQRHALSMSLGGPSNELLNRVKYLLGLKPSLRYVPDHSIWYYGSLMGVFLLFSIGKNQFFSTPTTTNIIPIVTVTTDTIPSSDTVTEEIILIQNSDAVNWESEHPDSVPIQVNVDTVIRVRHTDSIPRQRKSVIIQSDRKGRIIVDGQEVMVYDQMKMRKLQDSLRTLQVRMRKTMPEHQQLDSMMKIWKEEHRTMARKIKQHRLDTLPKHGFNFRPDIQNFEFEFEFPDSVFKYSFTIPSVPSMNLDSLLKSGSFKFGGRKWIDSTLQSLEKGPFTFYRDSLVTYFHHPNRSVRLHERQEMSREAQELNREIQEKQRELQELRKQKQQLYREEMKKQRQKD